LSCIGQILTHKIGFDEMFKRSGEEVNNLNESIHSFFLRHFGIVSVTERYMHDLFVAVRGGMGHFARIRTFAALAGVPPDAQSQALASMREAQKLASAKGRSQKSKQNMFDLDENDDSTFTPSMWDDAHLSPERLMQLRKAFVFYTKALHVVHSTKRQVGEKMKEKRGTKPEAAVAAVVAAECAQHRPSIYSMASFREDVQVVTEGSKPGTLKKMGSISGGETPSVEEAQNIPEQVPLAPGAPEIPSIPQLFPDVEPGSKHVWLERADLLKGCADVLFHEVSGFDDKDNRKIKEYKRTFFEKLAESAIDDPNGGGFKVAEVDEFIWNCMQLWAGIVKTRFMFIRRMSTWFGDDAGAQELCRSVHTIEAWTQLCIKKLQCHGKTFEKTLELRDQVEIFSETYRRTVVEAERSFSMMKPNNSIDAKKLIQAFEKAVLPTITIDLGGAFELTEPLTLHSDDCNHKLESLRESAKREKELRAKEQQLSKNASFAERARAKQHETMGLPEEVEKEEEPAINEYFESSDLILARDAWACYREVVERWIKGVEDGGIELRGAFDDEHERLGVIKAAVAEIEVLLEGSAEAGQQSRARAMTALEHRDARVKCNLCWSKIKSVLGGVHSLSRAGSVGKTGVTVEFLKDDWVAGRKIDVMGRKKIEDWI
jgi:hypothetical protein